jgi:hypothetical protein
MGIDDDSPLTENGGELREWRAAVEGSTTSLRHERRIYSVFSAPLLTSQGEPSVPRTTISTIKMLAELEASNKTTMDAIYAEKGLSTLDVLPGNVSQEH